MVLILKVTLTMINSMDLENNWLKVIFNMKVNTDKEFSTVKVNMNLLMEQLIIKELSMMVKSIHTVKIKLPYKLEVKIT